MDTNRIVLITGAAGGVGTVLVDRFVANGDTVIATDARQVVLDSWRTRWPGDAKIVTAAADISSETDVEAITELVRDSAGHLDVLINCAGYFPIVGFEEMTTKQWRQVIDINLTGTFLMTHALLPLMKDQGSGRIINFSSASIYPGAPPPERSPTPTSTSSSAPTPVPTAGAERSASTSPCSKKATRSQRLSQVTS
jgi:NAD(P)-dependent dehydrogenase (short-subunit alcohol dehydrogenase family)